MKKSIFIFTLLIFSFFNASYEYIVIPFKNLNSKLPKSYNFNSITGEQFLEFSTNKLVSSISLGTPYKSLELYLTMDYRLFFIGKGYCYKDAKSFYEPMKSDSYIDSDKLYPNPFNDLRNMAVGKEKCTLFSDYNLKTNMTLDKLQLYYGSKAEYSENIYDKEKICGIMGFKFHLPQSYNDKFVGLETVLKMSGVDNSSYWNIEFFDENQKKKHNNFDGYIILGSGDYKYLKDIKNITEDDIQHTYSSYALGSLEWTVNFQPIYFYYSQDNKTTMDFDYSNIAFNFDIKYYFATKQYFDLIKKYFFNEYISKGICKINSLNEFYLKYKYITCDKKNFNEEKKKFPTLYMKSSAFNNTFELTYEDLFMEVNNDKILFLMFYDPWSPTSFKFGQNFMIKYDFIFRVDEKDIGFINYAIKENPNDGGKKPENTDNKKRNIIWIVVLSVLLAGIIIGIFVGKKIWDNKRKKRANELTDDDYEYDAKKETINPENAINEN